MLIYAYNHVLDDATRYAGDEKNFEYVAGDVFHANFGHVFSDSPILGL